LNLRLSCIACGDSIVIGLARYRTGGYQPLGTLEIALRLSGQHFGLVQLCLSGVESDLEGARINLKQQLALADQTAFRDADRVDGAPDART
jgi:hypothetical protein